MTADFLLKSTLPDGLQPLDLGRHLGGLADLIEVCFGHEMDAAGRSVVREMHYLSRLGPGLRVLGWLGFAQPPWGQGFVWVEAGRVVGSVSATRSRPGSGTWLVANVAVYPEHRRRGIALSLTRATLDLIRSRGGTEAILQVDDDNLGAIELYRRLGFALVTTQTAWTRPARTPAPPHQPAPFDIRLRDPREWAEQLALATLVRPAGLAWDQPLHPRNFAPNWLRRLDQFFSGQLEEHWVVEVQDRLVGSLILRLNLGEGDRLTLLVHRDFRGQLERALLVRGLRRLAPRPWPVRVEHPADDAAASAVLRDLGFQPARTLRWMRVDVK
jgi:ribosomal protein S18 acetylase RimI-like enzyme